MACEWEQFEFHPLYKRCIEVFGTQGKAWLWWQSPNEALGGNSPMEFAKDPTKFSAIEELLNSIAQGFFV